MSSHPRPPMPTFPDRRPSLTYSPEERAWKQATYIASLARYGQHSAALSDARLPSRTFRSWLETDEKFAEAVEAARHNSKGNTRKGMVDGAFTEDWTIKPGKEKLAMAVDRVMNKEDYFPDSTLHIHRIFDMSQIPSPPQLHELAPPLDDPPALSATVKEQS